MEKISIKLHIDFEESIDVRSFTDLLDSIDKLFLYQALKYEEDIYSLQDSSEGITPKCLEIREVNKGSIELWIFLSSILSGLLSGLLSNAAYDGIKKFINKLSKKDSITFSDIDELIRHLPPDDLFEIRNICKSILNSNIKELKFTLPNGPKFKIDRKVAKYILDEMWYSAHHQRESAKTNFARRFLRYVRMKIYRDEFGRISGSINKNKSCYPVFFANERIKDFIYEHMNKLPEFYVEIEDYRVNGKTKYYEINGLSDYHYPNII